MDDQYPDISDALPRRHILIHSSRKEEVGEYSLLLASQSIKHWMEFDGDEWILSLEERDALRAQELIDLYRAENRGFQEAPPERRDLDLLVSPLLFLAVP